MATCGIFGCFELPSFATARRFVVTPSASFTALRLRNGLASSPLVDLHSVLGAEDLLRRFHVNFGIFDFLLVVTAFRVGAEGV